MIDIFYVYEWFIIQTLEIFYVGKGVNMRRFEIHNRSKYFKNIYNKYDCAVRLVHQSLTNEQACELEKDRIAELKVIGQARCNFTNGGTGFSTGDLNPTKKNPHYGNKNGMLIHNIDFSGDKNPFYGREHSEESKNKISQSRKGKGGRFGEENPAYGKSYLIGEKNGMYGRTGFNHPNSRMYHIEYENGETETLNYKACEKKFGIAFMRIQNGGGIISYNKKSKNSIYEGTKIIQVK